MEKEKEEKKEIETTLIGSLLWLTSILTCFYAPMAYIANLLDRRLVISGMELPKVDLPELIGIVLFAGVIYVFSRLLDKLVFKIRGAKHAKNKNE